jgi:hypothetical protein
MFKIMTKLKGICLYCIWLCKSMELHSLEECLEPTTMERLQSLDYDSWRRTLQVGRNQCFLCALSLKHCRRLDGQESCDFEGMVQRSLYCVWDTIFLTTLVQELGFRGDMNEDFSAWLPIEVESFGENWDTNLVRVWRVMCEVIEPLL